MNGESPEICVYGAGSVGCYLGGRLQAAGARVTFIGRSRQRDAIAAHGLQCTDLHGADVRIAAADIAFFTEAQAARSADVVLVTVKSAATESVARELILRLKRGALVISFQNGLHNAELLRRWLRETPVLDGMVPFNVLARGEGRFHQGSGGGLAVAAHPALTAVSARFAAAGLPLETHADMAPVLWSKLLLNLNNAINALSGLTLREELSRRGYRLCLAAAQRETLGLLRAAGIRPAQLTPIRPERLPMLLSLPSPIFRRLARRMVEIDPLARSSMWEDLEAGRMTEVDFINGEVMTLAARLGHRAPINSRLLQLIRVAEGGGRRDWGPDELYRTLRGAV